MNTSLRHACLACGGSCHGVNVRATGPDEVAMVEAAAATLGIEQPWVDGALRRVEGRCVFQLDDGLCGIHARLGAEHKPAICRQYPYVSVQTEAGEQRRGVDPGCYTWTRTWQTGAEAFPEHAVATPSPLPPPGVAEEASFVQADPGSMAAVLAWMSPGIRSDTYRVDWARVLRSISLDKLLAREETGPSVRAFLQPVLAAAQTWVEPPPWPDERVDAIVTETVRRMVWLRLAPKYPPRLLVHLLLGGGLAWAWTDAEQPEILAAWCRAVRAPVFASRIVEGFVRP